MSPTRCSTPGSPPRPTRARPPTSLASTGPRASVRAVAYPTLRVERKCWENGDRIVCGIDEVGRGAWAGPVTVAAVVPGPEHQRGIRDSKALTRAECDRASAAVHAWALAIGIGHASHEECDALGMTVALRTAAQR